MTRTLLITAGETPQVVTETLWALAERAWKPDRILLATTASGAALYRQGHRARDIAPLLGEDGRLAVLARLLWPGAPLAHVRLLVAEAGGQPLPDLRTEEEVEAFAEMLLAEVAAITADPASELHVSLAGGRKTMSFLAGQVMSLLGRPQDVLSHVLVEPAALEREPGFWWPGDGAPGSQTARVLLHEVPYLRARAWVEPEPAEGLGIGAGFAAIVARANRNLTDELTLDLPARRFEVGGEHLALTPREAALLGLVLLARKRSVQLQHDDKRRARDSIGERGIAIAGDREQALRIWSWLLEAASGPGKLARSSLHDSARKEAESRFAYDTDIGQPAARIRRALRARLSRRTAERVLEPGALSTRFPPAGIRILAPAELANDPDRPPEVECGAPA